jgi:putative tricarboxylic transport membrane protein
MLKTKRSGNIASGIFLALLGLAAVWASTGIEEGAGEYLHPRTFPMLLGILLFLGGGLLAVRSMLAATGDTPIEWPDRRGWRYWSIALVSLTLYVALSASLGFIICTFFFVAGFILYFGRRHPLYAAVWALGVVVFVYFVFVRVLDLTLPMGPLSFLS